MKRKLFLLIIFWLLFSTLSFTQESFAPIKRQDLKLDESLTDISNVGYSRPQKIIVAQVKPAQEHLLNDTKGWIRLMHYYGATRLGLPDMPFNYIIDRGGNIYETLENSEGRVPYIEVEDGTILIGYLSSSQDMTVAAQKGFKDLIENYSYKFGIPMSRIEAVDLTMKERTENTPTSISYSSATGFLQSRLFEMIKDFEYAQEANLRFSGVVEDLKYESSLNSGEKLKVEFKLKNTDSFPWYVDEGFVFLSTVDGEESLFAVNQVWESFSKPFSLEPQLLLPRESITLSFELDTEGVLPGKYEEVFKFVMIPDIEVRGTEFKIEFEVKKGDRKVVQIRPTGTGALTVYGCPSYTCQMVAAAISGERYLVIEQEELWYKISVDGVEGYVTIHYATLVD